MKVTFLVNSYATPTNLWCILGSLIQQTDPSWEAVVLTNHPAENVRWEHFLITQKIKDSRISTANSYHNAHSWDCYWACDWAVDLGLAQGDWICCASDDGYYMPEFVEEMTQSDADLVLCDLLMRKYSPGQRRFVVNALPKRNHVDKTNFMVRREKWIGFPHKNKDLNGPSFADGLAVEYMAKIGYKIDKINMPMCVHN